MEAGVGSDLDLGAVVVESRRESGELQLLLDAGIFGRRDQGEVHHIPHRVRGVLREVDHALNIPARRDILRGLRSRETSHASRR